MQLVTAHAKVRVSVQNQLSKLVPVKSGVGQNIAMHALPTASCFFLLSVHLPDLFSFICPHFSSLLFCAKACQCRSCVDPQNKVGHPAHCQRQPTLVPVLSTPGMPKWFPNFSVL